VAVGRGLAYAQEIEVRPVEDENRRLARHGAWL
jgi:hypothetical protein